MLGRPNSGGPEVKLGGHFTVIVPRGGCPRTRLPGLGGKVVGVVSTCLSRPPPRIFISVLHARTAIPHMIRGSGGGIFVQGQLLTLMFLAGAGEPASPMAALC